MKVPRINIILFAVSLALNAVCVVLFMLASVLSANNSSIIYYGMDKMDKQSFTAAAVVTAHPETEVVFNAIDLTMRKNEKASVQFSFRMDKAQSNYAVTALYDHNIIDVRQTGYGILITAVAEGETIMQTVTGDGIKDIIKVTVK